MYSNLARSPLGSCDCGLANLHHILYSIPEFIVLFLQTLCLGAQRVPLLLDCFQSRGLGGAGGGAVGGGRGGRGRGGGAGRVLRHERKEARS
jgi:hypothetical protein